MYVVYDHNTVGVIDYQAQEMKRVKKITTMKESPTSHQRQILCRSLNEKHALEIESNEAVTYVLCMEKFGLTLILCGFQNGMLSVLDDYFIVQSRINSASSEPSPVASILSNEANTVLAVAYEAGTIGLYDMIDPTELQLITIYQVDSNVSVTDLKCTVEVVIAGDSDGEITIMSPELKLLYWAKQFGVSFVKGLSIRQSKRNRLSESRLYTPSSSDQKRPSVYSVARDLRVAIGEKVEKTIGKVDKKIGRETIGRNVEKTAEKFESETESSGISEKPLVTAKLKLETFLEEMPTEATLERNALKVNDLVVLGDKGELQVEKLYIGTFVFNNTGDTRECCELESPTSHQRQILCRSLNEKHALEIESNEAVTYVLCMEKFGLTLILCGFQNACREYVSKQACFLHSGDIAFCTTIDLCDLPFILSALGFFPSEFDLRNISAEIDLMGLTELDFAHFLGRWPRW
ncbi:uncharacterized protein LOC103513144 [Diaphorina citri]|uniref:Uncharacterized protein LOC103513144 n=1 Tax=Diaphorina citri TaxID=121845 RepID=A0A3Q0J164_DIACI|nr:uncharacterized protein LOC103513144 [Diaphorina citri]